MIDILLNSFFLCMVPYFCSFLSPVSFFYPALCLLCSHHIYRISCLAAKTYLVCSCFHIALLLSTYFLPCFPSCFTLAFFFAPDVISFLLFHSALLLFRKWICFALAFLICFCGSHSPFFLMLYSHPQLLLNLASLGISIISLKCQHLAYHFPYSLTPASYLE